MKAQKPDPIVIPAAFVDRVKRHIEETGRPLLETTVDGPHTRLYAWPGSDGYNLSEPAEDWDPPFVTYREYAEYSGRTEQDIMDEHEFENDDELDNEMDLDIIEQLVDTQDGSGGTLDVDIPECRIEGDDENIQIASRHIIGNPTFSSAVLWVQSPLDLSLLQYVFELQGSEFASRWGETGPRTVSQGGATMM